MSLSAVFEQSTTREFPQYLKTQFHTAIARRNSGELSDIFPDEFSIEAQDLLSEGFYLDNIQPHFLSPIPDFTIPDLHMGHMLALETMSLCTDALEDYFTACVPCNDDANNNPNPAANDSHPIPELVKPLPATTQQPTIQPSYKRPQRPLGYQARGFSM
ncbi:MAG: hypothetical protein ACOYK8_08980 [Alphaproteobacteria bacterium]